MLLVAVGLVAVATTLPRQRGPAGFLGVVAAVTAVTSAAVFAVQMAVDGVALKAAVDAWVSAPSAAAQDAAYRVAESVRSLEKGLSALFNLTNGLTMLSLGAALALTPRSSVARRGRGGRGLRPGRRRRDHRPRRLLPRGHRADAPDDCRPVGVHRGSGGHRVAPDRVAVTAQSTTLASGCCSTAPA